MRTHGSLLFVFAFTRAAFAQPMLPEARVASLHGGVEVTVPAETSPRPARPDEALPAGTRLHTAHDGVVRLALPNGASLTLLPDGQLTLFASPDPPPPGQPAPTATTLSWGTLRFTAAHNGGPTLSLVSGGIAVEPRRGDGTVSAAHGAQVIRVSAYQGRVAVQTGAHRVLRAFQGIRESLWPPHGAIVLLAGAPAWSQGPPVRVTSLGGDGVVQMTFVGSTVERGGGFRAELARNPDFSDLVSSERLDRRQTTWDAHFNGGGDWYARVFAISLQGVEGRPSPTAHFTVDVPEVVPGAEVVDGAPARPATLRAPAGILCGIDGGHLFEVIVPVPLAPGRNHSIRCANTPDGSGAREFAVRARDAGPLRHDVRIEDTGTDIRMLFLRLYDIEGRALPYATMTAVAPEGVDLDPVREGLERGVYTASVRWSGQRTTIPLRFTMNGEVTFTVTVPTAAASPR